MKTLPIIVLLLILLAGGYYLFSHVEPSSPETEIKEEVVETESAGLRTVQLFYYNPALDEDETGNIMCSRDGLVPVTRTIASQTPIEDTLRLLLLGELTEAELAAGITTEYPLSGVSISSVALSADGLLRVEFADPENKLVGGSCRTGILAGQVMETAKQFEEVREVEFLPEDVFQP